MEETHTMVVPLGVCDSDSSRDIQIHQLFFIIKSQIK